MIHQAARLLRGSLSLWSSQSPCLVSAVKHSYGPKIILGFALAMTLAAKLTLELPLYYGQPNRVSPEVGERVSAFLVQQGFESRLEKKYLNVFIYAKLGSCRILITEADPQGSNRVQIEWRA